MRLNKKFAAIALTATVALTATAAFAYFTATGNGGGTATVGTSTGWDVSAGITTGGPLLPGVGSQTVTYTVQNDSAANQSVGSAAVSVVDTAPVACPAGNFTVVDGSGALGLYTTGQTKTGTATISLNESGFDQDGCKNFVATLLISIS